MPNTHEEACLYLSPRANVAWHWSSDGQVVEWIGGRTIVFRKELQRIVAALSSQGLPPLDGILFLITACREHWRDDPQELGNASYLFKFPGTKFREQWIELAASLDEISNLPEKWRQATQARIFLARIASEPCQHRTSAAVADEVCNLLQGESTELFHNRQPFDELQQHFAFDWLIEGLTALNVDRLETIQRTGLDRLPAAADNESESAPSVRELIAELEADDEFAGLARLAKFLMAGVTLPRSLSEPEDIPVGGISDITNRGSLDRLLLSELANDDDVLLTRVALNEVLYLRRESPPKAPPATRRIVVDCGTRMWGVPRVFGTAVALALTATTDEQTATELYHVRGAELISFDLRTREDVVSHLEHLQPQAHPGAAIARIDTLDQPDDSDVTTILITTPKTIQDEDFAAYLEHVAGPFSVATVTRAGDFKLSNRTRHGWASLAQQTLDLDRILGTDQQQQPQLPILNPQDPKLPAIFSVSPFPFRLPHKRYKHRTWDGFPEHEMAAGAANWASSETSDDESVDAAGIALPIFPVTPTVTITSDGRLMLWDCQHKGAWQLTDRMPPGQLVWKRCDDQGSIRAVIHNRPHVYLVHTSMRDPTAVSCIRLTHNFEKVDAVCEHGGHLFVVSRRNVFVFDITTGDDVQVLKLPNTIHRRNQFDRFFVSEGQVHALSYTGAAATLELVAEGISATGAFDCRFEDSQVILTYGGGLVLPNGDSIMSLATVCKVAPPYRIVNVSAKGNRIAVQRQTGPQGPVTAVVDIPSRKVVSSDDYETFGTLASRHAMTQRTIRTKYLNFRRIDHHSHGLVSLGILVSGARLLELSPSIKNTYASLNLVLHSHTKTPSNSNVFQIEHVEYASTLLRYRHFRSGDGSQIVADSRGLIHFKSSNDAIPEFSLLISEQEELAFWCSDGTCHGPNYFVHRELSPSESLASGVKFAGHLNRFLRELRQH